MKLSIIIPIWNEKETLLDIVKEVESAEIENIEKEIILVDDFSTDGTRVLLKKLESSYKVLYHEKNQGKGAALRTGLKHATGDFTIIQDADREYDPREYKLLLRPLLEQRADVVYGSRFVSSQPRVVTYYRNYIANRILTILSNILSGMTLTDMETCYKMFTREVREAVVDQLQSNRFGFEPEFTARVAKKRFTVCEVGISYYGRSMEQGKKMRIRDGFDAVWCIIKYNLMR